MPESMPETGPVTQVLELPEGFPEEAPKKGIIVPIGEPTVMVRNLSVHYRVPTSKRDVAAPAAPLAPWPASAGRATSRCER